MEQPPIEQGFEQEVEQEMTAEQLSEQFRIRRDKLFALQAEGNDPFRHTSYEASHLSTQIYDGFAAIEGKEVSIAGRMLSRRIMGKASFCHLLDAAGRIQVYVRREDVGEELYAAF